LGGKVFEEFEEFKEFKDASGIVLELRLELLELLAAQPPRKSTLI
jgi:hypothetical protein